MKNILEWIERSAAECPDKPVFADENGEISYQDFLNCVQTVGSAVAGYPLRKCPVLVLLPRGIRALTAMLFVYPAVFHKVKSGVYEGYFPDLSGCRVSGTTLDDAVGHAHDRKMGSIPYGNRRRPP